MFYRNLITLLAFSASLAATAEQYDLHSPRTLEGHRFLKHEIGNPQRVDMPLLRQAPRPSAEVTEKLDFTSFGMSFYDGANFVFDGGKLSKYKTTITWYDDGTVSVNNLLNLHGHNNDQDEELTLWGTYDAAEGIISIPTPLDEMTLVAKLWGEVDGYLLAGEATADYGFYPAEALELRVSEDRLEVETLQNALILEEYDGTLSTHTCYKYVRMYRPHEGQVLAAFTGESVAFEKPLFPSATQSRSFYIANVGSQSLDYVIDVEAEGECPFTASPVAGTLRSMIMKEVKVSFTPQQEGSYEATLSVVSEGGGFELPVTGFCQAYPDFEALVEEGDITFRTGVEYPFELVQKDGSFVAQSTARYETGDSWLEAEVQVPAGKIGTLYWTGMNYSDYNWGSQGTIVADDKTPLFTSYMGYEALDGHCMFTEGTHTVKFNFRAAYPEFITDLDGMEITGIGFTVMDMAEDAASQPDGTALAFGNFIEGQPEATLRAHVLNLGSNLLKCLSADDAEHFHVMVNDDSATTLDTLYVSVVFDVPEAAEYQGDVVLHTTAGDFTFQCSALVRQVPDYTRIVAADTDPTVAISWSYCTTDPFVIDEATGEAVNSNARVIDTVANNSWMEAAFTIPEGKMGIVTWDATLDIDSVSADGSFHDYAMVFISHPGHQFGIIDIGRGDMSSDGCYGKWEDTEALSQYYTSGENSIRWIVSHFGDSHYGGQDEFRVSNLSIALEDFPDYACKPSVEEIDFGQMLVGKSNSFTLQLTNMGGKELQIYGIDCDMPVSCKGWPSYTVPYKISYDLTFVFDGVWPGEYEGAITIDTSAGEVVLLYTGVVIDPTGYVMAEDFEDEMTWFRTDADGDGKGWNSLWNIYSTMSLGHCHSGEDGLGSSGYYYYMGDVDPDDWCYSPMVKIPAEGEYELSWWMGVDDTDVDNYAHNYSLYVGEEMNRNTLTHMYTEQISGTGWQQHSISLKEWAGREICVSFRHFDSKGLGIMKLDDVYIRPVTDTAIRNVARSAEGAGIYNLQGQSQRCLSRGLNIIRTADGVRKVIK